MLLIMHLCKSHPKMSVQIYSTPIEKLLYEGTLEDCPYRICDMEIVKMESAYVNGLDYVIHAD